MSDISTKMLTQTLWELECEDLIHREIYPQVPPKVEYSLSATGWELIPFIKYLGSWGYKKCPKKLPDRHTFLSIFTPKTETYEN